jgi:Flp pilus assembly protein TadD
VTQWFNAVFAYRWLKEDGKADAALAHVQRLLEDQTSADPQDAESQSWLGLTYAEQGHSQKGLPHIQSALALTPDAPQVVINAIEAYGKSGDESSAVRLIDQARKSGTSIADLKFDPDMQALLSKVNIPQ